MQIKVRLSTEWERESHIGWNWIRQAANVNYSEQGFSMRRETIDEYVQHCQSKMLTRNRKSKRDSRSKQRLQGIEKEREREAGCTRGMQEVEQVDVLGGV